MADFGSREPPVFQYLGQPAVDSPILAALSEHASPEPGRAGLSGGFAAISADLASLILARQHAWWACGVVGGTMVMVYWWVWGRIFKNVGLTVE
jgi:hypothetical protein